MATQKPNMLARSVGALTIIRYDILIGRIRGHRYEIVFQDGRRGDVDVYFEQVCDYQIRPFHTEFQRIGLEPRDVVATIEKFYPNGYDLDEEPGEHMRLGVGSSVLELLTEDAVAVGARAVFVSTRTKSMRFFLRKKGFTPHGHHETEWHKLLYSP